MCPPFCGYIGHGISLELSLDRQHGKVISQALSLDCLGLNPSFTADYLVDPDKLLKLPEHSLHHMENASKSVWCLAGD